MGQLVLKICRIGVIEKVVRPLGQEKAASSSEKSAKEFSNAMATKSK